MKTCYFKKRIIFVTQFSVRVKSEFENTNVENSGKCELRKYYKRCVHVRHPRLIDVTNPFCGKIVIKKLGNGKLKDSINPEKTSSIT